MFDSYPWILGHFLGMSYQQCHFGRNRGAGDWYTIYHHHLLQQRASFKPLYLSTNHWEFGTSRITPSYKRRCWIITIPNILDSVIPELIINQKYLAATALIFFGFLK